MIRIRLVVASLLLLSFHILAANYVWNVSSGDWGTSGNWSPNGIPGSSDQVTISSGTVTVSSNRSVGTLIITGGTLSLSSSRVLTVNNSASWSGGTITGSSSSKISFGASCSMTIFGAGEKSMNYLTFENYGDIVWQDAGEIKVNYEAHFINRSGANFNIENKTRLDFVAATNGGRLTNYGTITKTGNTGGSYDESQLDPTLLNYGTISAEVGIIQFEHGDTGTGLEGTFYTESGAVISFADRPFIFDGANFTGNGTVQMIQSNTRPVLTSTGSGMTFSSGTTFLIDVEGSSASEGYVGGDGPIIINGTFEWRAGRIYGSGSLVVNGTFLYTATTNNLMSQRTLTVNGDSYWTGLSSKRLDFDNGASIINGVGATFHQQSNSTWEVISAGSGSLINNGTFTKDAGGGTVTLRVDVTNNGTINVQGGETVYFDEAFVNATTGSLTGSGLIDTHKASTVTLNGGYNPGGSSAAGNLSISGNQTLSSSSVCTFEIGGSTQGSQYDHINSSSTFAVDGTLNISIINGFQPQENDEFTIINCSSRSGTFSTVNIPTDNGNPIFDVVYNSTSVVLRALFDVSLPVELASLRANGGFRQVLLEWTTASEINNLGFEVYRSTSDNGPFELVATFVTDPSLTGAGNSNVYHDYAFKDLQLADNTTYFYKLADVDYNGVRKFHSVISATTADDQNLISGFELAQNFPNPFNPETTVQFSLPQNSRIRVTIFDLLGRPVRQLGDGDFAAGEHQLKWDGINDFNQPVSGGVYFLRLDAFDPESGFLKFSNTKKMTLAH
ncbi:MAG: hypothetical protein KDH95_19870 [Calditrichaeota bacterium]|nr:hypothetical protein [Calditrichota bacterium]